MVFEVAPAKDEVNQTRPNPNDMIYCQLLLCSVPFPCVPKITFYIVEKLLFNSICLSLNHSNKVHEKCYVLQIGHLLVVIFTSRKMSVIENMGLCLTEA